MIKNLLDADEKLSLKEKNTVKSDVDQIVEDQPISAPQIMEEQSVIVEKQESFEIPNDSEFFQKESETLEDIIKELQSEEGIFEGEIFKNLQSKQSISEEKLVSEPITEESPAIENPLPETQIFTVENPIESNENETALIQVQPSEYKPPSKAETIRQSGLAWSAGVVFFGSIVFMMILGWFADLLLGTSPWGLVGGIVIGSIIGFIQFFRITSQIFKNK